MRLLPQGQGREVHVSDRASWVPQEVVNCGQAISACGRLHRWSPALALLQDLCRKGFEPSVVVQNAVITACGRARQWEHSLLLIKQLRSINVELTVITYGAGINACCHGEPWEISVSLLAAANDAGIETSIVSLGSAVCACEAGAHWTGALQLLMTAQSGRFKGKLCWESNTVIGNAAVSACGSAGQWVTALALVAGLFFSSVSRVQPDIITCNACISACGKMAQWTQAVHLLGSSFPRHQLMPDVVTCNACISACGDGSQWNRALQLLGDARRGLLGNLEPDEVSLAAAICACQRGQRWRHSLAILQIYRLWRFQPNAVACNTAISACEKGEHWVSALAILADLRSLGGEGASKDVLAFNAACSACEVSGCWEHSVQLLRGMEHCLLEADVVTYTAAIGACARGQRWHLALSLAQRMQREMLQPNSLTYGAALAACEAAPSAASLCSLLPAARQTCQGLLQLLHCTQHQDSGRSISKVAAPVVSTEAISVQHPSKSSGLKARSALVAHEATKPRRPLATSVPSLAVAASEPLHWHCQLDAIDLVALRRCILASVLPALRVLGLGVFDPGRRASFSGPGLVRSPSDSQAAAILELTKQPSLGHPLTSEAASLLGIGRQLQASDRSTQIGRQSASWFMHAQLASRVAIAELSSGFLCEPSAKAVPSQISYSNAAGGASLGEECRSRVAGYATAEPVGRELLAVSVEHDRAPHSERQALLVLLKRRLAGTSPK
ncbi:unnamed protein product [Polarella glacialis]|uniref:Pentatricopeptide repeat-containing protein, chloroplastic n=1 Tax=Polarella glacialis TaxID=89957 RepID=A0A813GQJ3_POLGL|nr:unnamed protein product [Polarella glacialis]